MENENNQLSIQIKSITSVTNEPILVQLLLKAFKEEKLHKGLFLYKFIETQLQCLLHNDARGFRWDIDIIHWATTLQYYGGAKIIKILRGEALESEGKFGSLPVIPEKWGLFLPAISTLKNYKPYVDPYNANISNKCKEIVKIFDQKEILKVGGLVFDEMELRHGLVYLKSTGRIIGLWEETMCHCIIII